RVARAPHLPRDLSYPLAMPMQYPDLQCRLPSNHPAPSDCQRASLMVGQISVGDPGQNYSGGYTTPSFPVAISSLSVETEAYFGIAVGTPITGRPPHRTVRAAFLHTAPTSDD